MIETIVERVNLFLHENVRAYTATVKDIQKQTTTAARYEYMQLPPLQHQLQLPLLQHQRIHSNITS